ncbi:MAG: M24 family metallopeptidase [Kiritimatiellia bacterium]
MRTNELVQLARRLRLDTVLVADPANIRALTGIACDSAVLQLTLAAGSAAVRFFTDFRYVPMVRRVAPTLACRDIRRLGRDRSRLPARTVRVGYEPSISHARFLAWQKLFPRARFVDVSGEIAAIRAVKTADEIAGLRAAESLNCAIWETARIRFRAGMTERELARIIRQLMAERGDGEAFDTIVCVGRNAAECHHEPDDTVWNGREPVLVDMGVKLNGFCSDLTRNVVPPRPRPLYRQVYDLVQAANRAAIAAARPGMTGRQLDQVARAVIRKGGFGRCFGHSLGHGVGYEIHEPPYASPRSETVLQPGMVVTIEPGVYLEGNLGVRIEDLVLITADGCEVLSGRC